MKRLWILTLGFVLIFSLAGCMGDKDSKMYDDPNGNNPNSSEFNMVPDMPNKDLMPDSDMMPDLDDGKIK